MLKTTVARVTPDIRAFATLVRRAGSHGAGYTRGMRTGLTAGVIGNYATVVGPPQVIRLGATEPNGGAVVFSTPAMIKLMELAAREALRPYLEEGEDSVGVRVEVEHLAATPIGSVVRAEARVTAIDARQIDFEISAHDGVGPIGRGTHRRAVITLARFTARLDQKRDSLESTMPAATMLEANRGELPALETLLVERRGAVATITLNRPRNANAVDSRMTSEWEQVIAWLAGHGDTVRVAIVTGAGDYFCAGDDVKEVATLAPQDAEQLSWRQARLYLTLEQLPQPVIAAVNGAALGAGCVCAYSCDFRLASTAARFGMPEIKLGWPPGYGIAQLTALVGKARALQLCLTGAPITAQQSETYGLVHQVVPHARLLAAANQLADQLLALPARALRETKRLVHADEGEMPKIAYLADTAGYIRCLQTPDAREGIAAFIEKRPPKFGS